MSFPLWRPRSIRASRFLLFCIDEKYLYQRKTMNAVLRRAVWSLNVLFTGIFPSFGPWGEPFNPNLVGKPVCGPHRFAITELRGDQLWHKQIWSFRASWKGGARESLCCFCEVYNMGDSPFFKVEEGNEIGPQYSLIEFINKQLPERDICT